MKSRILDIAHYTTSLLLNLDCKEDAKKIEMAERILKNTIQDLKELPWDQLFAIGECQELTAKQQAVIEDYATLKRILLETYRDMFQEIKKI